MVSKLISDWLDEVSCNLIGRNLSKQIEILTGGWVMTEEAPSHHFAMIDQLIEGHVWLDQNLEYHPKNGYNCDTFGATPTTAYLNQLRHVFEIGRSQNWTSQNWVLKIGRFKMERFETGRF